MKRRKFITIAGLGATAVALPTITFNSNIFLKQAVSSIIHRELHYLQLDPEGVKAFTNDFTDQINSYSFERGQKLRMKIGSEYLFPGSTQKLQAADLIVSEYLLASDFFTNKMNEARVVEYVALYNAYKKPCANPFSHLYYSSNI